MEATESEVEKMRQDMYQLHHFNFTGSQFVEELKACILVGIKYLLGKFEIALCTGLSNDVVPVNVYVNCLENVRNLLENKILKTYEKFEKSIKDLFIIPRNVVLPMDVGKVIVTEEDVDKSKQDIIMIKEEYEKMKVINYLYKKELQTLKFLEPVKDMVSTLIGDVERLTSEKIENQKSQQDNENVVKFNINKLNYFNQRYYKK